MDSTELYSSCVARKPAQFWMAAKSWDMTGDLPPLGHLPPVTAITDVILVRVTVQC